MNRPQETDIRKAVDTAWDILTRYTRTNRVFCSSDYERVAMDLAGRLNAKIHRYDQSEERGGWVIAPRWDPQKATISRGGKIIYDGMSHPLALIALSEAFCGSISREELKEHLHFDHRFPEALPYHFRQMYRPWERDWGFCVPKVFFDSLEPGNYEVEIQIAEGPGELVVVDASQAGKRPETIVFAAHLDHPGMANDDLAGCAVGVALMQWMQHQTPKFTYRLVLHQEVIAPEYFLAALPRCEKESMIEGVFLEMLGTETEIGFQSSIHGRDRLLDHMRGFSRSRGIPHRNGEYGEIVVNGEYVWESHGISLSSFSRFPFPEYHSSLDDISILSKSALAEAFEILMNAMVQMEEQPFIFKDFEGTFSTANPDYGLYVDPGQIALRVHSDSDIAGLRQAMERLPTLRGPVPLDEFAATCDVSSDSLRSYLRDWEAKGLVMVI